MKGRGFLDQKSFVYKRFTLASGEEINYNRFFLVHISDDCRGDCSENADGKMGLYLGLFDEDDSESNESGNVVKVDMSKKINCDTIGENDCDGTPLIQIGENEYIWGSECYWQPVYQGQELDLEASKEFVRSRIDDMKIKGPTAIDNENIIIILED